MSQDKYKDILKPITSILDSIFKTQRQYIDTAYTETTGSINQKKSYAEYYHNYKLKIEKTDKIKVGDTVFTGEEYEICLNYILNKAKEELPEEFL